MKAKHVIHKISLKFYLIFIFILSILIAVIVTGIIIVTEITERSKVRMEGSDAWLVSQLCETAIYQSSQVDNLVNSLVFDNDIQSAMIAYEYGESINMDQLKVKINTSLVDRSRFNKALYECTNIVMFSRRGDVIGIKETFNQQAKLYDYEWYEQVKESHGKSLWMNLCYDNNSKYTKNTLTLPIIKKIYSTQSSANNSMDEIMSVGKELGYVMFNINVDMFSNIVADNLNGVTKQFLLVDGNNIIISSKEKGKIGETFAYKILRNGYIEYDGHSYLMTQKSVPDKNWNYICLTNREEVTRESNLAWIVCWVIGFILIFLFSINGFLIAKYIGKPVTVLKDHFRQAENEENVAIADKAFLVEFESLYQSFNHMVNKIHNLANQIYEDKLEHQELVTEMKESQIQALQMQINPHFLYNTLDCINWQARLDGNNKVSEMILCIGNFFRSNMSMSSEFTTIKDEIENIRLYIKLSQLRFGSRLHCFIDVKEELYPFQVIKLLLQPFVENSIKYGLEEENTSENIWIWVGEEEEELVISLRDDGNGIEPEKLDYIRSLWATIENGYQKTESIGMYNAMRRLYLCYKDQCNCEVFSKKGKGTEVVLTFPKRKANIIKQNDIESSDMKKTEII